MLTEKFEIPQIEKDMAIKLRADLDATLLNFVKTWETTVPAPHTTIIIGIVMQKLSLQAVDCLLGHGDTDFDFKLLEKVSASFKKGEEELRLKYNLKKGE